jgi:predicted RNA-binding protein with PUA-like domain
MRYWLFKSEPETFSIDHLRACRNSTEHWDGVRNYQARNMLRDEVKQGDEVLFYHSNCSPPGIVGIAKVVKAGYPDFTAWDPRSDHFDPKTDPDKPRWFMVDVKFVRKFKRMITLDELKQNPKLESMLILRNGNRLSITPVTDGQCKAILKMAEA